MKDSVRANLDVGSKLGRYRLRYRVAHGGMATVYLAQLEGTHGFERWVAIKVIHPHLAEERRFANMLLDEARVVARIHHPNVCAVLDFGEQGNALYLVMEYLHAESLSSAVRRAWGPGGRGLPLWLSARVVADAARGLHAAHEIMDDDGKNLGVVHRDVSPQNILVLYDGMAKVVDFGIARARGRLTATDAGEVKGKFAYMSPEHLQSEPVDARADVWSLGVLLWEATVGRRLFRGEAHGSTVMNVMQATIPRPSEIIADYPPKLEEAVMGALERDRNRRTPTAAAVANSIDEYLYSTGKPAGAPQVSEWMRANFSDKLAARDAMLRAAPDGGAAVPEVDLVSESSVGSHLRPAQMGHGELAPSIDQTRPDEQPPPEVQPPTLPNLAVVPGAVAEADDDDDDDDDEGFAGDTVISPPLSLDDEDQEPHRPTEPEMIPDGQTEIAPMLALDDDSVRPVSFDLVQSEPPAFGPAAPLLAPAMARAPAASRRVFWLWLLVVVGALLVFGLSVGLTAMLLGGDDDPPPPAWPSPTPASSKATPGSGAAEPPSRPAARETGGARESARPHESGGTPRPRGTPPAMDAPRAAPPPHERSTDRERPPEAAPLQPPGTLNLLAIPPAIVYRGPQSLGRTPLVNVELPVGVHRLRLEPVGGGPSKRVTVRIRSGRRTVTSVRLGE